MLCINGNIKEHLGLRVIDKQIAKLANGKKENHEIVWPVELIFENPSTSCRAMVLPDDAKILLGSIPMEDLDVIIDPKDNKIKIHPLRPYMT